VGSEQELGDMLSMMNLLSTLIAAALPWILPLLLHYSPLQVMIMVIFLYADSGLCYWLYFGCPRNHEHRCQYLPYQGSYESVGFHENDKEKKYLAPYLAWYFSMYLLKVFLAMC